MEFFDKPLTLLDVYTLMANNINPNNYTKDPTVIINEKSPDEKNA